MKCIRWTVTSILGRPGPLLAFVQMKAGEPEAGDRVRCVETGKTFTVIGMALGLGQDAIAAGRRGVEFDVETATAGLDVGMTLENM